MMRSSVGISAGGLGLFIVVGVRSQSDTASSMLMGRGLVLFSVLAVLIGMWGVVSSKSNNNRGFVDILSVARRWVNQTLLELVLLLFGVWWKGAAGLSSTSASSQYRDPLKNTQEQQQQQQQQRVHMYLCNLSTPLELIQLHAR